MLKGDGVPNDVMNNFNSLTIILCIPIMNYGVYPWLRQKRIKFGAVAQITTGFAIATIGGLGKDLSSILAISWSLTVFQAIPSSITSPIRPDPVVSMVLAWPNVSMVVWLRQFLSGGWLSRTPWAGFQKFSSTYPPTVSHMLAHHQI